MSENNTPTNPATQATGRFDVFEGVDPNIKIRTKKMMMWFIIFAVVMLFAGITSALIVLYGKLMWIHIAVPSSLWISVGLVIASSITLIMGLRALKAGKQQLATVFTGITFLLGIGFVVAQNQGWTELSNRGMGYTITQNEQGLKSYRWNTIGRVNGEYGKDFFIEWHGERVIRENGEFYMESDAARSEPVTNQVMTTFNASAAMLFVLIYVHIVHLSFGLIYLLVNTIRLAVGRLNKDNWISLYTSGMYWHFMGILWVYLFFFVFFIY